MLQSRRVYSKTSLDFIKIVGWAILLSCYSAGAAEHAYVINSRDGTVSIIDTSNHNIIATVDVGAGPTGVAITPTSIFIPILDQALKKISKITWQKGPR